MTVKFSDEDIEAEFAVGGEGEYQAEIAEVKESSTKNNDEMWVLKFKNAETGEFLCYDNIVFSKNGKGIAWKKIKMLGVEKKGEFYEVDDPQELVGKRVALSLVKDTYQGKEKLVPDFESEGFGYAPADIPF